MTILLNELHDLTIPVAEDFNFNFRAMQTAVEAMQALVATAVPSPTGAMVGYPAAVAPNAGWLVCDGAAYSRTTYAALWAFAQSSGLVGTAYGVGDGSTTFTVPDCRGRVLAGFDATQTEFNTFGKTGGEITHTLTTAEMPVHAHGITANQQGTFQVGTTTPGGGGGSVLATDNTVENRFLTVTASVVIANTGSGAAHNNLPPYFVANVIVKT